MTPHRTEYEIHRPDGTRFCCPMWFKTTLSAVMTYSWESENAARRVARHFIKGKYQIVPVVVAVRSTTQRKQKTRGYSYA